MIKVIDSIDCYFKTGLCNNNGQKKNCSLFPICVSQLVLTNFEQIYWSIVMQNLINGVISKLFSFISLFSLKAILHVWVASNVNPV